MLVSYLRRLICSNSWFTEETNIDILDEGVSSVHSAVKIPASLLTVEADPVDMSGEAGELATYEVGPSTNSARRWS